MLRDPLRGRPPCCIRWRQERCRSRGENSIPTFTTTPRTSSVDLHAHRYWHSSKPRSTHLATQPRAAQRQGEFDTYGLHLLPYARYIHLRWLRKYHSAFFSPLSHSRSLSSSSSPHNHRSYHSLSALTISEYCIRCPPSRDAVRMGRGSREWARRWKRQYCSFC
jgi:hypothetical protein